MPLPSRAARREECAGAGDAARAAPTWSEAARPSQEPSLLSQKGVAPPHANTEIAAARFHTLGVLWAGQGRAWGSGTGRHPATALAKLPRASLAGGRLVTGRPPRLWFCPRWPREGSAFQEKKGTAPPEVLPERGALAGGSHPKQRCAQPARPRLSVWCLGSFLERPILTRNIK